MSGTTPQGAGPGEFGGANAIKRNFLKPQVVFLVLAIVFGLSMLIFSLPFRGPDEEIHFYKAYAIANGDLLSEVRIPPNAGRLHGPDRKLVGSQIPTSVIVTTDRMIYHLGDLPADPGKIVTTLHIPALSGPETFRPYSMWSSIAVYSPVSYLPQVAGILVGRAFSLSPIMLLYLARLGNLLVWMMLVYFAIKIIPVQKWTMVLLAVMPLTINVVASVSADTIAIGLSFLFTAYVLKLAFAPEGELVSYRRLGFVLFLALLLALAKPPYFLLVFLLLMIPARKLRGRKRYAVAFAVITATTFAVVASWNLIVRNAYVARLDTIVPGTQLSHILKNPFSFVWTMARTAYHFKFLWAKMFVGGIGWLEVKMPVVFLGTFFVALIVVALLDPVKRTPTLREKGVSVVVYLGCAVALLATFYLTWTVVGGRLIEGFQPRYLIPVTPLLLLLFANSRLGFKREWILPAGVTACACISIVITLAYMVSTYY